MVSLLSPDHSDACLLIFIPRNAGQNAFSMVFEPLIWDECGWWESTPVTDVKPREQRFDPQTPGFVFQSETMPFPSEIWEKNGEFLLVLSKTSEQPPKQL